MKKYIKPSHISGIIKAPASKSVAQRVIALAALAKGQSEIHNQGHSHDVVAAIKVCKTLGIDIEELSNKLIIKGGIIQPESHLNCGESGLGIRMFSSVAATLSQSVTLTGEGSLAKRPMLSIEESLSALGVVCKTQNGYLPITITGPIRGGIAKIDGSLSSQVLTGILMAAPLSINDTKLIVENLQSKPYIDLTIEAIKAFGVNIENRNYEEFHIKGNQQYKPTTYNVEGDWSGAAFLLVAGAIAGSVKVENLNPMSKQADRAIIQALMWAGAKISIQDKFIEVGKNELNSFHFDATHCPDLFPPLVALAAHCEGESRILGVSRLRSKESDRATTLQQEFSKLGIKIEIDGEMMRVYGSTVNGGSVSSHGDHRIAMACAIAALAGNNQVEIGEAEAVDKSYPHFFDDLSALQV